MRSRTEAHRHRAILEILERRDVPSSVGLGENVFHVLSTGHAHVSAEKHGHGSHDVFASKKKKPTPVQVIAGPQGPAGPTGPQGPAGPTGATGPAGPSGTVIPFSLAAGASSAPIAVAPNTSVYVIATSTTSGDYGTASMTVVDRPGLYLDWSGENSTTTASATPTLTGGFSGTAGTKMLTFDYSSVITLQVFDANDFVIHNASAGTATGDIWILTAPAH